MLGVNFGFWGDAPEIITIRIGLRLVFGTMAFWNDLLRSRSERGMRVKAALSRLPFPFPLLPAAASVL